MSLRERWVVLTEMYRRTPVALILALTVLFPLGVLAALVVGAVTSPWVGAVVITLAGVVVYRVIMAATR